MIMPELFGGVQRGWSRNFSLSVGVEMMTTITSSTSMNEKWDWRINFMVSMLLLWYIYLNMISTALVPDVLVQYLLLHTTGYPHPSSP